MIYVLKILLDQTNLSLFLHLFLLLLFSQTTVKPIQVIIISLIIYSSSIVFWSFSYHLCIVEYWPVC